MRSDSGRVATSSRNLETSTPTNHDVLIAIGINWEGQRQVLGVDLANRESQSSWRDFVLALKQRGLSGVELAVSDDHAGLRKATAEILGRKPPGNAATCTSCATAWTTCRARLTTTACRNCAGSCVSAVFAAFAAACAAGRSKAAFNDSETPARVDQFGSFALHFRGAGLEFQS